MATTAIEEDKLKDLIKAALVEVLESRRDLTEEMIQDAIEDFAFGRAIEQGSSTEAVSHDEIFAVLEDGK